MSSHLDPPEQSPSEHPVRETFDLPEIAARLGVSRTSIYRWANNGTLPTIRLGRRLLVPRAALEELLTPSVMRHDEEPRNP